MIKAMNSKAFDTIKDGMKDGMDTAWKQSKRVSFRTPWLYNKPAAIKSGGWMGIGILSLVAAAIGVWLYFRKRQQVADRYTMGEGPGPTWDAAEARVDDHMAPASP